MKYHCKIMNIDEDEVTVQIKDVYITGFVNCGVDKKPGQEATVDVLLFDDLEITPCDENKVGIERKSETFEYSIWGTLDITKRMLRSVIDFDFEDYLSEAIGGES